MKSSLMRLLAGFSICAICLIGQTTYPQGYSGHIAGKVTDSEGKGLAGAVLHLHRVPLLSQVRSHFELAPGEVYYSVASTSDSTGSYKIDAIPAGRYLLCAEAVNQPFLDPCKWSKAVSVSVTQSSTTLTNVVLIKGVFLRIRVNDPLGLPPANLGPLGPPPIICGVKFGAGAFLAANYSSGLRRGDFVMPIPMGRRLQLWLFSRSVRLIDSLGHPVDTATNKIAFIVTAPADTNFSFTVSGRP